MKIATFNAASIRARLPIVLEWLAEHEPDVLAVQETKVEDDKFPREEFEELGYHLAIHGQKSWNGVVTLSRLPATGVRCGFSDDLFPSDCRLLVTEIDGLPILNTYVPNGNRVGSDKFDYKLRWLERFVQFLNQNFSPQTPLIWLGDVNIAPTPLDVYDSKRFYGGVGHHPEEFKRLDRIKEWGLTDLYRMLHPEERGFTFWDFVIPNSVPRDLGWRIDHIYATEPLVGKCLSCEVDRAPRLEHRPSDHTFLVAEFEI